MDQWTFFLRAIAISYTYVLFLTYMPVDMPYSEEIFDYSAEQMTQVKTKNLKNSMCGEFSEIFQLCSEVLEKANKPSLIKATLNTLLRFLNWIPLGYIFETSLVENLRSRVSAIPKSCLGRPDASTLMLTKTTIHCQHLVFGSPSVPQCHSALPDRNRKSYSCHRLQRQVCHFVQHCHDLCSQDHPYWRK